MAAGSSKDLQTIPQEFQNTARNIESARFLKRVIEKAQIEEPLHPNKLPNATERAFTYTGFDKRTFPHMSTDIEIRNVKEVERSLIHEQLIAFYLNPGVLSGPLTDDLLPTTKNLFKCLHGKIPIYIDIRTFRKLLASMGYIWLRIAKGYIVMERPEVTFERYHYLKDVVKYRGENREIFYVDETVLTRDLKYYKLKKYNSLMKSAEKAGVEIAQDDLIKSIFAVSKSGVCALKHVHGFTSFLFENWVLNELLPILPGNSVVVIRAKTHDENTIKKPTLFSLKTDMMDWLDRNDVPYDENMSKCDLISLIDKYTSETDEINKIETELKLHGHELLRLPSSIEEMSPAELLFEFMKLNVSLLNKADDLNELFDSVSPSTYQKHDDHVAECEREMLQIDVEVDEVIDNVIKEILSSKHKISEPEDSEVPLSDSD